METNVETNAEEGVSTLVGGIVHDMGKLLGEQLTLFQVEIKNDLHRTLAALTPFLAGAGIAVAGLLLLSMGSAHLLCWAVPELPLWGGYGIVGGVFVTVGVGLIYWAKAMLDSVSPLLPDTSLKALKENIQWKTKR
jgi:uncharacterized membrane protein YqjE